jgi:molecular chaperone GrpE
MAAGDDDELKGESVTSPPATDTGSVAAGPSASGPDDEVARLRDILTQKETEAQTNHDNYLRAVAELENFRKRVRREQGEALRFACEGLIRDLVPVVDNLQRAVAHAAGGGNGAPLVEGVSLVLRGLEEVLKRHGVSIIEAQPGEPFDPAKHEAVARQEGEGEPNRVVSQPERGFRLHDRLLRPAKVVVSSAKSTSGPVEKPANDD